MTQTTINQTTNAPAEGNMLLLWFATVDPGRLYVVLGSKCQRSFTYTASESSPDPEASSPDASPLPLSPSPENNQINRSVT